MPKGKGKKSEQVEISDNNSDTDLDWSDGEAEASPADVTTSNNVDILKQLILHGFDVKGKLRNGNLEFVFRTPKFTQNNGESRLELLAAPDPRVMRPHEHPLDSLRSPTIVPSDSSSHSGRSVHSGKKKPIMKRDKGSWLLT